MTEIDLIQANANAVNLAYTASQWWLTVSTALIVAVYFASRHIPPWFFAMTVILYLCTAVSSIFELTIYSAMAASYDTRLSAFRAVHHIPDIAVRGGSVIFLLNGAANYAVFILGTAFAIIYATITWRAARET